MKGQARRLYLTEKERRVYDEVRARYGLNDALVVKGEGAKGTDSKQERAKETVSGEGTDDRCSGL